MFHLKVVFISKQTIDIRSISFFCLFFRITRFIEKPEAHETDSRLASVVFYCFKKETLKTVHDYLNDHIKLEERTFGRYMVCNSTFYLFIFYNKYEEGCLKRTPLANTHSHKLINNILRFAIKLYKSWFEI